MSPLVRWLAKEAAAPLMPREGLRTMLGVVAAFPLTRPQSYQPR